ncbi:MAG: RHS repeat-associated core domain-containing protein, partial [Anaerovoracaceae bacterium]|nr:RHS repeat-associated core domain-containing protein [Anaerovoracaceae bacterium]
ADGDRIKMIVDSGGSTLLTRYYFDNKYEIDGVKANAAQRLYIGGDAYSAPAVYVKEENSSEWKIYYICRDYLGSITHVANADGTLKQELSYDAWGRLRNPETQVAYAPGTEPVLFLGRGYTGHEHLPQFGLINMNARLYDPVLGRFLSPDPYVQTPDFTQSFNRYSYCLNNPLVYVDEDGEFWHLIIGAVIGGIVNWASHGFKFNAKGLGYFAVGAAVGTLSAMGGAWAATTFKAVGVAAGAGIGAVSGGVIGGGSSFLLNGGNNLIGGNNFFENWKSSLISGAINGAITGAIGGGIKGYNNAKKLEANRWTGHKATHKGHFSTTSKTGILQQQDPTKHCYSVSGEYADAGHNNFTRIDFQNAAARLNNGLVPDGADIGLVAREAGLNANEVKMGTSDLLQFGANLQQGTMEGILTIGSNLDAGHTVNVISFDVIEKLNVFGGGSKLLMSNTRVWDPLTASVRNLTENIMKFVFIKY